MPSQHKDAQTPSSANKRARKPPSPTGEAPGQSRPPQEDGEGEDMMKTEQKQEANVRNGHKMATSRGNDHFGTIDAEGR